MNIQIGKYYAMLDTVRGIGSDYFIKVATKDVLIFFKKYVNKEDAETEYNKILEDLKNR